MDPERLLDHGADDFELGLLRSASRDVGSDRALQRALGAVGVGVGVTATASAASASAATASVAASAAATSVAAPALSVGIASNASALLMLKWIVCGSVGGVLAASSYFALEPSPPPAVMAAAAPAIEAAVTKLTKTEGERIRERGAELATEHDAAPPMPGAAADSARTPSPAPPSSAVARAGPYPASAAPPVQGGAAAQGVDEARAPASPSADAASVPNTRPAQPAQLSAEVAALDRARAVLAAHQPALCLSALDAYERDFPHGVLAPEATVLRIEALVRAGDRAGAASLAKPILEGSSPHATRVRSLFQDKDTSLPNP